MEIQEDGEKGEADDDDGQGKNNWGWKKIKIEKRNCRESIKKKMRRKKRMKKQ